jgi:predicted transport protein
MPKLSNKVLDSYNTKPDTLGYSINDHPHLLTKKNRELFEAFRKEVLTLDPCVTEEFFKLYVAYKAETNFVDIVPQANRLRLSLNMSFSEINDPKDMCKDVTKLGRWGNGDVEIGLSSLNQIPYVIGLVRQSLEKQMGNAN